MQDSKCAFIFLSPTSHYIDVPTVVQRIDLYRLLHFLYRGHLRCRSYYYKAILVVVHSLETLLDTFTLLEYLQLDVYIRYGTSDFLSKCYKPRTG